MIKTLQRVILLIALITFVEAGFWPWEGKDDRKSKKAKKVKADRQEEGPELADSPEYVEAPAPEPEPDTRKTKDTKFSQK
jgi:hypothetical protein